MEFSQALRVAARSLSANKLRSALTILGMTIGVGAVITLIAIGQGAQAAVQEQFNAFGTNLLFIEPGNTSSSGIVTQAGTVQTLTFDDALAIMDPDNVPSASVVSPEVYENAQFVYRGLNTAGRVNGVTPPYADIRNYHVAQGEWINDDQVQGAANVVVLGYTVAQNLFGEISPIGQQVRVNTFGRSAGLTVIGVGELRGGTGFANPDNALYIPLTTQMRKLTRPRGGTGVYAINRITLQAVDSLHIDTVQQELTTLLLTRHHLSDPTVSDFAITSQADRLQTRLQVTSVLTVFLGAVAGISLVVGGIGIMNIMIVSVTERTREIGIRKAVGASRHDIMMQFLVESLLISALGGVGGIVVGVGLAQLVNGRQVNGSELQTLVSVQSIVLAAGVSAAIGLFFGIYPASRAARLNPIQALRYE